MKKPEVGDILWRAESYCWDTEYSRGNVDIVFYAYAVLKVSRCKMWITESAAVRPDATLTEPQLAAWYRDMKDFIEVKNRAARVMYAWPTKELALKSLRARTEWRVTHAQRALNRALAVRAYLGEKSVEELELPRVSKFGWPLRPANQENYE